MNLEQKIFEYLEIVKRQARMTPLNLGGVSGPSGGGGGPPGGILGWLPQNRVAYDESELELSTTSGIPSLVDNLNHIRYRLSGIENGLVGGHTHVFNEDISSQISEGATVFTTSGIYVADSLCVYYDGARKINFTQSSSRHGFTTTFPTHISGILVVDYILDPNPPPSEWGSGEWGNFGYGE
jgi:hypothetical protein